MASTLTCDACGNEILTPMDRGLLQLPPTQEGAGASMDLCRACCDSLMHLDVVTAGKAAYEERFATAVAAAADTEAKETEPPVLLQP